MSADVRPGYKQTELGVIPQDWNCLPLKDVLIRGRLGGNYENSERETYAPLMKMGNINRGNFSLEKIEYIQRTAIIDHQHKLNAGDVLLNTRNTLELVGKVAIWRNELPLAYYNSNLMRLEFNQDKIASAEYANYALNSKSSISRLKAIATGTTSVAAIYTRDLLEFYIPVPPRSEQVAIGNAISDLDCLISGLDQLIAKKRDIQQAAMQQLLTGQRRLPGFSGEWVTQSLMEIAESKKALFDDGDWVEAEHITDQGVRLIQTGNIGVGCFVEKTNRKYIYEESFESLKCKELKVGDILICRLAEPAGRACIFPDIGENKVITSVDVTIFRPRPEVANRNFLVQIFSTGGWFKSVLDQVGGTTHKRISRGALGRIKISLPHIDEQTAIATILSDMNAELAALEVRRDKARQLKQGMMQELLTGKTRLL